MATASKVSLKINANTGTAFLQAPYHPDAPAAFRALGGRWDGIARAWLFDARDAERVAAECERVYGANPLAPPATPCTMRVRLEALPGEGLLETQDIWLAGRRLCWRPARDSAVRLGEGVVVAEGAFTGRGGSARYPALGDVRGVVLEVRDVPAPLAERERERHPAAVEIVAAPAASDPAALIEEQLDRLLAQLPPERRAAWLARQQQA